MFENIVILGHRGMGPSSKLYKLSPHEQCDYLPENTIVSFNEAFKRGADGIELDVFLSKDGVPIVIHDDELNRNVVGADFNGGELGLVSEYTAAELKRFDVGRGESMPTLEEVILSVLEQQKKYQRQFTINIEIKDDNAVQHIIDLIRRLQKTHELDPNQLLFCSFSHDALRAVRRLDSDLKLAASIKTSDLYGKDSVDSDFNIKPTATYDEAYLAYLRQLHQELHLSAFDAITWDIEQALVELSIACQIDLCASFTDFRAEILHPDLPYHKYFLEKARFLADKGLNLFVKTDQPKRLLLELADADQDYTLDLTDLHEQIPQPLPRLIKPAAHSKRVATAHNISDIAMSARYCFFRIDRNASITDADCYVNEKTFRRYAF